MRSRPVADRLSVGPVALRRRAVEAPRRLRLRRRVQHGTYRRGPPAWPGIRSQLVRHRPQKPPRTAPMSPESPSATAAPSTPRFRRTGSSASPRVPPSSSYNRPASRRASTPSPTRATLADAVDYIYRRAQTARNAVRDQHEPGPERREPRRRERRRAGHRSAPRGPRAGLSWSPQATSTSGAAHASGTLNAGSGPNLELEGRCGKPLTVGFSKRPPPGASDRTARRDGGVVVLARSHRRPA